MVVFNGHKGVSNGELFLMGTKFQFCKMTKVLQVNVEDGGTTI